MTDKRRHQRFSDLIVLYVPLQLEPVDKFTEETLHGNLLNISKGGIAIRLGKELKIGMRYKLTLEFPDRSFLASNVVINRVNKKDQYFIIGLQFIRLVDYMARKIDKMASDYNECEEKILQGADDVCRYDCGFYVMCKKPQKSVAEKSLDQSVRLELEPINDSAESQ